MPLSVITEEPARGVCENHKSEMLYSYTPHDNLSQKTCETSALHFKNYLRNVKSHVKIFDKDEFLNNFTSSYQLHYSIIPDKYKLCGPMPKFNEETGKYDPRPDELSSFGNHSNTGLRQLLKWERRNLPIDWTETKISFRCHPVEAYKNHPKPIRQKLNKIFEDNDEDEE